MPLMAWPSRSDALSAIPAPESAPESSEAMEVDVASAAAQNSTKKSIMTIHVRLGGMEHSKTHPKALASLGTAHTWSFGALAEVGTREEVCQVQVTFIHSILTVIRNRRFFCKRVANFEAALRKKLAADNTALNTVFISKLTYVCIRHGRLKVWVDKSLFRTAHSSDYMY
eukprot:7614905-Pyramimonas_sp.AAC.1